MQIAFTAVCGHYFNCPTYLLWYVSFYLETRRMFLAKEKKANLASIKATHTNPGYDQGEIEKLILIVGFTLKIYLTIINTVVEILGKYEDKYLS